MSTPEVPPIADAAGSASKRGKRPDPTKAEHALGRAALAFAGAARAVEDHTGARSGIEYGAKVEAWRSTYAELLRVAGEYPGKGK